MLHGRSHGLDGADRFVAEDASRRHFGDVALQDVEVGAADRHGVDAHDRVRVGEDPRIGNLFPCLASGTVVHECLHRLLLVDVCAASVTVAGRSETGAKDPSRV